MPLGAGKNFAIALLLAFLIANGATQARASDMTVTELVALYEHAMTDSDAPKLARFEMAGTISGGALVGSFHTWHAGDRERVDQNLGLRYEQRIRLGKRYFYVDESGNVREYHGSLLRHARTQDLIDSADFSDTPDCCRLLGLVKVAGRDAYEMAVTAQGGDTEILSLDAHTALPLRVSYDEDDGRTTIDFSDWRSVGGHRFAFRNVASNGSHTYDMMQTTESVSLDVPMKDALFAVPVNHWIQASGMRHVGLIEHENHFFVPVTIAGRSYTFLVDSGAQGILIDTHVAHMLGLQQEGTLEASGVSRTGGLKLARLKALEIAGATMRDIVVATLDLGASTRGVFRIDGILGYPFFASAVVRMDFAHKIMDFGPPGALLLRGDRLNIDFDRGLAETEAIANGVRAPFLIDTGNAAGILLYRPFVDRHPSIVPQTLTSMRSYGVGGATDSYRSTLHEFVLGSITLSDIESCVMLAKQGAFADRIDAGNIGLDVLKHFVVTFDDSQGAVYFEKYDNAAVTYP